MDEQKNGTPAPRRRRRADVQRTVISEDYTDSFQPEEAKPREEARQPRSEVRKPAQSSVQRQVWEDEYDDFDDEPRHKKGGKKHGKGDKTGCLIGIIILLLIVIVVFALGWIVFPAQKDDILTRIGIMATAEPTITPTIEPTATPTAAPTAMSTTRHFRDLRVSSVVCRACFSIGMRGFWVIVSEDGSAMMNPCLG